MQGGSILERRHSISYTYFGFKMPMLPTAIQSVKKHQFGARIHMNDREPGDFFDSTYVVTMNDQGVKRWRYKKKDWMNVIFFGEAMEGHDVLDSLLD